ncbi:hypothetical protein PHLGIDRAFT_443062 [Phlebiopsis gigantea 11061_1 CR5-6]|uniref:Uncharacterized protein n=1 Tax=Phlebiopsis gigantea (strain 11061_1 CR5-6) TaxID=745531 RepID=A0A0C3SAB7_PHLG1|nr:hypothetical protein PHLGIDRAFT_443062 [Phlebiopsis gigantea 11061_1 CR5-6]
MEQKYPACASHIHIRSRSSRDEPVAIPYPHTSCYSCAVFRMRFLRPASGISGPSMYVYTDILILLGTLTSGPVIRLTRSCVIAGDLLVIVLIWIKTYNVSRQARHLNIKTSLTTLFLRDGSIYFLVLLVVNIAHMIVYEVAVS